MSKLFLIFCYLVFSLAATADIENPYSLPVGDREALMGNAGVALSGSAGNMFYNPSGLVDLQGNRFTAGGSAYALISGRLTPVANITTGFDEFVTVPNMAASTRHIGDWVVGLGVFVPLSLKTNFEFQEDVPSLSGNLHAKSDLDTNDQYLGLSGARHLENDWSIGVSLFAHRYSSRGVTTSYLQPYSGSVYLSSSEWQDTQLINLLPILGAQKKLNEKWLLGLAVNLPELKLLGKNHYRSESLVSNAGTPTQTLVNQEYDANYQAPADLSGGLKYESGKWLLTFNLGALLPTTFESIPGSPKNWHYDTKLTFRQHLGLEYKLSDTQSILGGFLRSPDTTGGTADNSGSKAIQSQFYSTTLGYYIREQKFTSGIGVQYTVARQKEEMFNLAMDHENGMRMIGVLASTSIEY